MSKEADMNRILNTLVGVGVGVIGIHLVREYGDKKYISYRLMPTTLKGFGAPSALIGVGAGGIGTVYEVNKVGKSGMKKGDDIMIGAAAGLLFAGIVSGLTPTGVPVAVGVQRYAPQSYQNVMPRQMPVNTNGGYPLQVNGVKGGSV